MEKLIIIGGGVAGYSAGIYAGRALLSPTLIEGIPGGQLALTSDVENYPGFDNPILGPVLMSTFKNQAIKMGTKIINDKVVEIKSENNFHTVVLESGKELQTKAVLVATGADAKWLGLESEQKLRGKGVSACATCDGPFFKDKHVVVVGGGDSAMEESNYLSRFASKVTLVHRRGEFRASKIMQEKVKNNPKVEILLNSEIKEVLGSEKVEGVLLLSNGKEIKIECDGVFLAIGHEPSTKFLANSPVLMDEKGYILTKERVFFESFDDLKNKYELPYRYSTNVNGIFAAGDCADFIYKQAGTASGMAIAAVLEIEKYLESLED